MKRGHRQWNQLANNYKGRGEIKLYERLNRLQLLQVFRRVKHVQKGITRIYFATEKHFGRGRLEKLLAGTEVTPAQTQTGQPAPAFTAYDGTGSRYSLSDFKGKVVYLDFRASRCAPCRAETPYLKSLADRYK